MVSRSWGGKSSRSMPISKSNDVHQRAIIVDGHCDTPYRLLARYMTLTHVNTNNWCDSSGDGGRHGGLTDFGREVVQTMNDIGMIVDISHVSDAAFYAAAETTRAPLVATHSSCRALCRH